MHVRTSLPHRYPEQALVYAHSTWLKYARLYAPNFARALLKERACSKFQASAGLERARTYASKFESEVHG